MTRYLHDRQVAVCLLATLTPLLRVVLKAEPQTHPLHCLYIVRDHYPCPAQQRKDDNHLVTIRLRYSFSISWTSSLLSSHVVSLVQMPISLKKWASSWTKSRTGTIWKLLNREYVIWYMRLGLKIGTLSYPPVQTTQEQSSHFMPVSGMYSQQNGKSTT